MSAPVGPPAAPAAGPFPPGAEGSAASGAQRNRGYSRWTGARDAQPFRWWVIARGNLGLAVGNRWVKLALALSLAPGFIATGVTYFFLPLSAPLLDDVLHWSLMFVFLIGAMVGARMVSEDRRQGAFLAHFSRPVTRLDYILGKLVALALPLFVVASASGLLTVAADAALPAESVAERAQREAGASVNQLDTSGYLQKVSHFAALQAVVAWGLLASVATAGIVLGISALTSRARLAGVAWFAVVAFGWAAHLFLQEVLDKDWPALLSWWDNVGDLSSFLLGIRENDQLGVSLEYSLLARLGLLLLLAGLGTLLVELQLRRAEGGMR